MASYVRNKFTNQTVILDGHSFDACEFTNCIFVYGGESFSFTNNFVNGYSFRLVGNADNAFSLLSMLKNPGSSKRVIEEIVSKYVERALVNEIPVVYRFFDKLEYANDLLSGKLWLTTLEKCRAYEDSERGDEHEATHVYNSGHVDFVSGDPKHKLILARVGIEIEGHVSSAIFDDNVAIDKIRDAFLYCTTETYNEDLKKSFGEFCVEIRDPLEFMDLIIEELSKKFNIVSYDFNRITYRERSYSGTDAPPGKIGFIKPMRYQPQKEIRFLFSVQSEEPLVPFALEVPAIAKLCRLVTG